MLCILKSLIPAPHPSRPLQHLLLAPHILQILHKLLFDHHSVGRDCCLLNSGLTYLQCLLIPGRQSSKRGQSNEWFFNFELESLLVGNSVTGTLPCDKAKLLCFYVTHCGLVLVKNMANDCGEKDQSWTVSGRCMVSIVDVMDSIWVVQEADVKMESKAPERCSGVTPSQEMYVLRTPILPMSFFLYLWFCAIVGWMTLPTLAMAHGEGELALHLFLPLESR